MPWWRARPRSESRDHEVREADEDEDYPGVRRVATHLDRTPILSGRVSPLSVATGDESPQTRLRNSYGDLASGRRAPSPPRVDEGACAVEGRPLLRRPEADPRPLAEHDLRRGQVPEHLRVLGPRHGDLPDSRRHVPPCGPVLLRALRPARGAARRARAAARRAGR